jgi:hypothetical protein
MKLTKETLKRIIKEELDKVMNEEELDEGLFDFFKGKKKEEPQQQMPSVPEPTDPNSEPEEEEELDPESREIIRANKKMILDLQKIAVNFLETIRNKEGVELINPNGAPNADKITDYINKREGSGHNLMLAGRALNALKQARFIKNSMYTDRRSSQTKSGNRYKDNPDFFGPPRSAGLGNKWQFRF